MFRGISDDGQNTHAQRRVWAGPARRGCPSAILLCLSVSCGSGYHLSLVELPELLKADSANLRITAAQLTIGVGTGWMCKEDSLRVPVKAPNQGLRSLWSH